MALSAEQIQLLFYEIILSIGNGLDLRGMLKESLSTYLRKLNCSAGGVLRLEKGRDGLYRYVPSYTIPRNIHHCAVCASVSKLVLPSMDEGALGAFRSRLPLHEGTGNSHIHIMELPGFGLLFIIKNDPDLDSFVIKSLAPLNRKLASACLACLQKEEIDAAHQRLQAIILSSHDWIWETDAEGRYTYASDSVKDLFGYEPAEMMGKTCFDLMPEAEARKIAVDFTKLVAEKAPIEDLENWVLAKDGRRLCMLTNGFPILHEGHLKGYRGVDKDISLWKSAEEQLRLAKEKAERVSQLKGEFLANISHEIRTPMNAILGFTDFLCEDPLSERQQGYVETLKASSQSLLRLIDDILDLSRIEAGNLDIEIVSCSLDKLIEPVEALLGAKALGKRLDFRVDRGELPQAVETDPTRIQQCLVHLVNNAIKFTEHGHVVVRVSHGIGDGRDWLRFDVEDTGIGIPQEKHKEIFKSFTQVDGSTSRKYGGTGLGLTITRQLAELLGGHIQLQSQVGHGSTFTLMIPVRRCHFAAPVQSPPRVEKGGSPEPAPLSGRVLVAEDDRVNQTIIRHILEKLGLDVTIVDNGQEVVDRIEAEPFDLVVMDIQMPVMNGYEATRHLRERSKTPPIIALTAHAMKGEREKCLDAGCDDYLTKPIDKKRLTDVLRHYLLPTPATP